MHSLHVERKALRVPEDLIISRLELPDGPEAKRVLVARRSGGGLASANDALEARVDRHRERVRAVGGVELYVRCGHDDDVRSPTERPQRPSEERGALAPLHHRAGAARVGAEDGHDTHRGRELGLEVGPARRWRCRFHLDSSAHVVGRILWRAPQVVESAVCVP